MDGVKPAVTFCIHHYYVLNCWAFDLCTWIWMNTFLIFPSAHSGPLARGGSARVSLSLRLEIRFHVIRCNNIVALALGFGFGRLRLPPPPPPPLLACIASDRTPITNKMQIYILTTSVCAFRSRHFHMIHLINAPNDKCMPRPMSRLLPLPRHISFD